MAKKPRTWRTLCDLAQLPLGHTVPLDMMAQRCAYHGHPVTNAEIERAYGRWVWGADD